MGWKWDVSLQLSHLSASRSTLLWCILGPRFLHKLCLSFVSCCWDQNTLTKDIWRRIFLNLYLQVTDLTEKSTEARKRTGCIKSSSRSQKWRSKECVPVLGLLSPFFHNPEHLAQRMVSFTQYVRLPILINKIKRSFTRHPCRSTGSRQTSKIHFTRDTGWLHVDK